ncbi:MAG: rubrerythrin [Thermofilum sp. ex4484_79]|nr:MAG: rubrerythrin [Thermofilum sp. ex4484_79]
MLSKIPINIEGMRQKDIEKVILRTAIIAELDAISLYEEMASLVQDEKIKKVLLDVAKEEKTHVGEFLALLNLKDEEQEQELREGEKEVREILGEL